MTIKSLQQWIVAWLFALLSGATTAAAVPVDSARSIAVLYPDIGEPYRSVFATMIEGIENQLNGRVTSIPVGNNPNQQTITSELRRQNIRVVIALGRNGLKAAADLGRDIGVVAGGVISAPETGARLFATATLSPDPAQLFARLQFFQPAARRVFVVYDPAQNAWLMQLAKLAASARGIELVSHEAGDLKTALNHYQAIIATMARDRDALWLPLDSTSVSETSVLPLVLQEAWRRNLVVFSSNVSHVRRGALFSLFPNNQEVGRNLADYALDYLSSSSQAARGVLPLKAALLAVNVRTAAHLGIDLAGKQASFDLVLPER